MFIFLKYSVLLVPVTSVYPMLSPCPFLKKNPKEVIERVFWDADDDGFFHFSFQLSFCLLFWPEISIFCLPDHFFFFLCHLVGCLLLSALEIELQIFDWFIFIVSSSLLQLSAFILIIFPNSVDIFITTFINSGFGRRVSSVSLFVLSGDFSCSFN